MDRAIWSKFGLGVAALVVLAGCGKPSAQRTAPPPAKVTVAHPVQQEVVEWDEYTGRLESPASVEIRPRVSGYLTSIDFEDGQMVKEGDLLFVIDPRPYQAAVERAEAAVELATNQLTLAESNFHRAYALREKGVTAAEDFETRQNDYQAARAELAEATAALTPAKLNIEFTRVTSPIAGKVGRYEVSVGNLISGGSGGEATLLTTVVSRDPLRAYFEVDEQSYLRYIDGKNGLLAKSGGAAPRIEMRVASETGYPHVGTLDFVDNQVDTATGTIQLRGEFANPDLLLTPGLFAHVRVPAREKHLATMIPDAAVGTDQSRQFVYVVNDRNEVELRTVVLGPIANNLRIVRSGLTPEDQIVVNGLMRVKHGTEVDPEVTTIAEIQAAMSGAGAAK